MLTMCAAMVQTCLGFVVLPVGSRLALWQHAPTITKVPRLLESGGFENSNGSEEVQNDVNDDKDGEQDKSEEMDEEDDEYMAAAFEKLNELAQDAEAIQALREAGNWKGLDPLPEEFVEQELISTTEGFELYEQTMQDMKDIFKDTKATGASSAAAAAEDAPSLNEQGLSASTLEDIFANADALWGTDHDDKETDDSEEQ